MREVKLSRKESGTMIRFIWAEFMKMKHTCFYWLHLAIPILAAFVFLLYYGTTGYNSESEIVGYVQALSIAFPFIVSLVCSIAMETEEKAARYYHLFGNQKSRVTCFLAKYIMLLGMGAFSTVLAVMVFALGYQYILKMKGLPYVAYFVIILILVGSICILYLFHLLLDLYLGKGVSLMVGGVESLIAALFLTGLGDRVWSFVPCSYGVRFISCYLLKLWDERVLQGIFCLIGYMILLLILFGFAVKKYER